MTANSTNNKSSMKTSNKVNHNTISRVNLTEPQRLLVYRLYAEFKSPGKVMEALVESSGVIISAPVINDMCRDAVAQVYINKFREEFLMKVKEVPIANKRVRLEELQKNVSEINEMKDLVDIDEKSGRMEKLMMERRLNETVCAAREEIEGKPMLMQQFNFSQYQGFTDEELQRRKEELIDKAIKNRVEVNVG